MIIKILRIFLILVFGVSAYTISNSIQADLNVSSTSFLWKNISYFVAIGTVVFGLIGLILPNIIRSQVTVPEAFGVIVGLAIGLVCTGVLFYLGSLARGPYQIFAFGATFAFGSFITLYSIRAGMAYIGQGFLGGFGGITANEESNLSTTVPKVLDTSVIIDGRILDIAETHFVDGPLIIPNFVLREIQLISDSSDAIKRSRGRRGLEMLNKLMDNSIMEVKITYKDYTDTREVDAKLVKLSIEKGYKLVTNDFNLHKVAELQGIKVLNLNNLANALKPVVLPGEEIIIQVMKEGKDDNQGIGYLEDGTMVVVENGRNLLGKDVKVNVTSIIQTAAGKMIFTKSKETINENKGNRQSHSKESRNRSYRRNR